MCLVAWKEQEHFILHCPFYLTYNCIRFNNLVRVAYCHMKVFFFDKTFLYGTEQLNYANKMLSFTISFRISTINYYKQKSTFHDYFLISLVLYRFYYDFIFSLFLSGIFMSDIPEVHYESTTSLPQSCKCALLRIVYFCP